MHSFQNNFELSYSINPVRTILPSQDLRLVFAFLVLAILWMLKFSKTLLFYNILFCLSISIFFSG